MISCDDQQTTIPDANLFQAGRQLADDVVDVHDLQEMSLLVLNHSQFIGHDGVVRFEAEVIQIVTVSGIASPGREIAPRSMRNQQVSEVQHRVRRAVDTPQKMFHLLIATIRPPITKTSASTIPVDQI